MFTLNPTTPQIGAEISDVDLRSVDVATGNALVEALDKHLVLFFRDQPLDPEGLARVGKIFGPLDNRSYGTTHPDFADVVVFDTVAPRNYSTDSWHADLTYTKEPPTVSVLQAIELPTVGGDTCWANMYAVYEGLSSGMQAYLEGLTAIHDTSRTLAAIVEFGVRDLAGAS